MRLWLNDMKKRLPYIILLVLIITVETLIALFVKGGWLRYYGGDVIVVWGVYCLAQSIICSQRRYAVHIGVLVFAFIVEFLQMINIVDILGLGNIEFFRILIGTSFAAEDLLSYLAGTVIGCAGTAVYSVIKQKTAHN